MSKVLQRLKREPALAIGVLATVALAAQDALANGNASWRTLVPAIAAALIRQKVTPATNPKGNQ